MALSPLWTYGQRSRLDVRAGAEKVHSHELVRCMNPACQTVSIIGPASIEKVAAGPAPTPEPNGTEPKPEPKPDREPSRIFDTDMRWR